MDSSVFFFFFGSDPGNCHCCGHAPIIGKQLNRSSNVAAVLSHSCSICDKKRNDLVHKGRGGGAKCKHLLFKLYIVRWTASTHLRPIVKSRNSSPVLSGFFLTRDLNQDQHCGLYLSSTLLFHLVVPSDVYSDRLSSNITEVSVHTDTDSRVSLCQQGVLTTMNDIVLLVELLTLLEPLLIKVQMIWPNLVVKTALT